MAVGLSAKWKDIITLFSQYIKEHNENVSRKMDMAMEQLIANTSVEQYQQVGITMRDAWVEFSQSIFKQEFLPEGISNVSSTDVKRLIEYSLRQARGNNKYLLKMSRTSFDLCNKLEHDLNATLGMTLQCITSSASCMALIHQTMSINYLLARRPYYKCPNCGSIKLEIREQWIPDIEGAFKVDKLVCIKCGWGYIEELGGMSGIE